MAGAPPSNRSRRSAHLSVSRERERERERERYVNQAFGTRFSDEEYDTIGGLVLHELGRMPRRGETIQIGGLEIKVLRADRRRIETLRVITPRDLELAPPESP